MHVRLARASDAPEKSRVFGELRYDFAIMVDEGRSRRAEVWVIAAFVALTGPALFLDYLPMTDYPQHLAIVSILRHLHDPAFAFDRWFEVDLGRTLYLLPYGAAWLLSHAVSVDTAMHLVAFASLLAYPLGLLAVLRALGRPPELALLAAPFVYNRAFFWGFINFNLAVGLSLMALAAFLGWQGPKRRARTALFAVAVTASVITHVYGIALLLGVILVWATVGGFSEVRKRLPLLALPTVGALVWFYLGSKAEGYDVPVDPPLGARLLGAADAVCGGFLDGSDNVLLVLGLLVVLLLAAHARREHAPGTFELAVALTCLGNFVLYFLLPQATATAKWIHFRHAFLAVALVPLLVTRAPSQHALRLLPLGLSLLVSVNAWHHLLRFDAEASVFDEVVLESPAGMTGLGMNFAQQSRVVKPEVYIHFIAYVQARKGGFIAMSFPQTFWNLPVKIRRDANIPATPAAFEWDPGRFSEREFGWFYDWVLVRLERGRLTVTQGFPFERTFKRGPWQVYRRMTAP